MREHGVRGVVHLAAKKAVDESVREPLLLLPGERRGAAGPAGGGDRGRRRVVPVLLQRGGVRRARPGRRDGGRRVPAGEPVRAHEADRRAPGRRRGRGDRSAVRLPALLQRGRLRDARAGRPRRHQPGPDGVPAAGAEAGAADLRRRLPDAGRDVHPGLRARRRHRLRARGRGSGAGRRRARRADRQHRPGRGRLRAGDGPDHPRGHRDRGRGVVRRPKSWTAGPAIPRGWSPPPTSCGARWAGRARFGVREMVESAWEGWHRT